MSRSQSARTFLGLLAALTLAGHAATQEKVNPSRRPSSWSSGRRWRSGSLGRTRTGT